MFVKICGITRAEDARLAERAGADAIGLNFAPQSKRLVTAQQAQGISEAVGPFMTRVGVFVNAPLDEVRELATMLRLDAVQLHGDEDAAYAASLQATCRVIKAWPFSLELTPEHLRAFPADAILLDGLKPGSGEGFDWSQAAKLRGFPKLILAGGLTPHNVEAGIRVLQPYAVDVASGVESSQGVKDPAQVQDFVRSAQKAALFPDLSTVIHSYPQACG